jgi:hypothetical protein
MLVRLAGNETTDNRPKQSWKAFNPMVVVPALITALVVHVLQLTQLVFVEPVTYM